MKMMPAAALAVGLLTLSSCNLFDPFDSPGSDERILSAARACFDNGDFECARDYYGQLEGTPYTEIAASEKAFAILDQAGAGINHFLPAVLSEGGAGKIITAMADRLSATAGVENRKRIWEAYQFTSQITTNTELRGLVRFVASFSLAAEILAEDSGADGSLDAVDIAQTPSGCTMALCLTGPAACDGAHGVIVAGTGTKPAMTGTLDPAAFDAAAPTWLMFQATLQGIVVGKSEMGGASIGGSTSDLDTAISQDPTVANGGSCVRAQLIGEGIGN